MDFTLLMKSLDPGINVETVQYNRVRKKRASSSNRWGESPHQLGHLFLIKGTTKMIVLICPIDSVWFTKFMLGLKKIMGLQRRQDLALSIEMILDVIEPLEKYWRVAEYLINKRKNPFSIYKVYWNLLFWSKL